MTADSADYPPNDRMETLAEQLRRKGVQPIQSIHDLAAPEIFESDEELDEFLAFVRAERDANLA